MNLIESAYKEAVKALKKCESDKGIFASGASEGYRSLWARDSMISLLGGALVDVKFKSVFRKSLLNLVNNQAPNGQIPNAIGIYDPRYHSYVTYNTIDSSLWFIIGAHVYAKSYEDSAVLKKLKKPIAKAFTWITYQDVSEEHLPAQLPTTDWQDAFPHKYGHTINTESLYYAALIKLGKKKEAAIVKNLVGGNLRPHLKLWNEEGGYFLPWAWKDHNGDREEEHWFDSLGNLLAILTNLATEKQAKRILDFIRSEKINRPYPVKAIWPPIRPNSKLWKSYFSEADSRDPYHYLNAGVWPFIGGFYVAALVKMGEFKKAERELIFLADANQNGRNREWEFNEWFDGKTGKPSGGTLQAWSIGMYIYAYECVRTKKVPFF